MSLTASPYGTKTGDFDTYCMYMYQKPLITTHSLYMQAVKGLVSLRI